MLKNLDISRYIIITYIYIYMCVICAWLLKVCTCISSFCGRFWNSLVCPALPLCHPLQQRQQNKVPACSQGQLVCHWKHRWVLATTSPVVLPVLSRAGTKGAGCGHTIWEHWCRVRRKCETIKRIQIKECVNKMPASLGFNKVSQGSGQSNHLSFSGW